jgi:eukaryotic translation initiation factor 2C
LLLFLGEESSKKIYKVSLTLVDRIFPPAIGTPAWKALDPTVLQALDTTLLSFARFQQINDDPTWFIAGSKLYNAAANGMPLLGAYMARRGIYASIKCCLAGAVLVADMTANIFMSGGPIVDVMMKAGGFRNQQDFENACNHPQGLAPYVKKDINSTLKGLKIKLIHIGHSKKAQKLGPPANSPDSAFDYTDETGNTRKITVADYYELMAKTKLEYKNKLKNGKLAFPRLPTINVGNDKHPILVPAELIYVPGGQSKNGAATPEMVSQIIRYAAIRPDERMRTIIDGEEGGTSVVNVLRQDPTAKKFGTSEIAAEPMNVAAYLLPPPKLVYGGNAIVEPRLEGGWNIDRPQRKFVRLPPAPSDRGYMYGIMIVSNNQPSPDWSDRVKHFKENIEKDAQGSGLRLTMGGPPLTTSDNLEDLRKNASMLQNAKVKIVLVILNGDFYGKVKLVTDTLGLVTQCAKWKNIYNPPRGFHLNVVLKINTKLGGTNHTLASRLNTPPTSGATFQDPPASISWVMDKPTMLLGIDVSHPEKGQMRPSMAAVVGSMDGRLNQYAAHLSAQTAGQEIVAALEDAVCALLTLFKTRNNRMPEHIIVYRDGVSEGQFPEVIAKELPSIQGAIERMGNMRESVKITIVVCQKRHNTRIVYEEKVSATEKQFINPCPGLVIDARGGDNSITSATLNEFYINSHAAIQGTSKPCKYTLIYDEIGFKLSELELLTYWTTYLYIRCNKSVSYATPAYYAHWASKRCKDLVAVGAGDAELAAITKQWTRPGIPTTMFFL